jgi:type II secretory pathway component GspD/PulD (secretin)
MPRFGTPCLRPVAARRIAATLLALCCAQTSNASEADSVQQGGSAKPLPPLEVTRANALAAAGHRDEAMALLELHISENPNDATAKQTLLSLRIAHMEEEIRNILAQQAKSKQIVIGDPDYEAARNRSNEAVSKRLDIAEYYAHNRRYPEAVVVCNAILKEYPHHPAAQKLKYRILTEMVEKERADLLKEKALRRTDAINDSIDGSIMPGELPKTKRTVFIFDEDIAEAERSALRKKLLQRVDLIYDGTNGTKSAQVREVLQPLFAIAGINYVILDSALSEETLTIHLVHETVETALSTIARLVNIRYNYSGGTVYISSADSEVMVTEIIRIHSGLTDVKTEPQIGENSFGGASDNTGGAQSGSSTTGGGGGGGTNPFAGGQGGGQGGAEATSDLERFLEKVPEIVVGWPAEGKIYLEKKSNTIYVRATPSAIQETKRLLEALDYNSTQVFIEARFIEVSDTGAKELGIDWAGGGKAGDTYVSAPTNGLTLPNADDAGASINSGFGNISGLDSSSGMLAQVLFAPSQYLKFKATISALENKGQADTLSEPKILTLNNAVGVIEVRKDISYVSSYQNAGYNNSPSDVNDNNNNNDNIFNGGVNYSNATLVPQFTKDYEGIALRIRPSVARNSDIITLTINPTVRELVKAPANFAFSNVGAGGGGAVNNNVQSPPEFDTRRLVTALHVKNGGTVSLGGLSREKEQKGSTGLPFLSRVPVIGSLFRRDTNKSTRSNLMIFVTAHIVDPQGSRQGSEIQHLRDTARVVLPAEAENLPTEKEVEKADPIKPDNTESGPIWRRDRRR